MCFLAGLLAFWQTSTEPSPCAISNLGATTRYLFGDIPDQDAELAVVVREARLAGDPVAVDLDLHLDRCELLASVEAVGRGDLALDLQRRLVLAQLNVLELRQLRVTSVLAGFTGGVGLGVVIDRGATRVCRVVDEPVTVVVGPVVALRLRVDALLDGLGDLVGVGAATRVGVAEVEAGVAEPASSAAISTVAVPSGPVSVGGVDVGPTSVPSVEEVDLGLDVDDLVDVGAKRGCRRSRRCRRPACRGHQWRSA